MSIFLSGCVDGSQDITETPTPDATNENPKTITTEEDSDGFGFYMKDGQLKPGIDLGPGVYYDLESGEIQFGIDLLP